MTKYILTTVLAFLLIWVPTLQASPPCGVQYQYQSYPVQQQYYYQYQTYNNLVAVLPAVFVPAASYTVGYAFAPKEEQKQELKLKEADDKLDKILHAVSGLDAKISAQDARITALESRINAGGGSSPGSSEWREPRLPQRSPEPIPAKPKQQPQSKLLGAGDVLAVACASCHRTPEKKGGFTYSAAENLTTEQREKILETVAAGKMPPRSSPQLTPEARRTLLQYMAK